MVQTLWDSITEFLAGGDKRTAALQEGIRENVTPFVPPNLRKPLGLLAEMNPVQDIYRAGGNVRGGNYVDAGIDTAIAAAPVVGGVLGRVGAKQVADTGGDAARAAMDTLLGGAPGRSASAVDTFAARMNQPGPVPDMQIFAGPKAKTADLSAMRRAEEMLDIGADRDEVWQQTGWFRGPDGQMRFEIDDRNIGLRSPEEAAAIGEDMRAQSASMISGINEKNANLKIQPDLFPAQLRAAHGDLRREADKMRKEANSVFGPDSRHDAVGQRAQYAVTGDLAENYPDLMRQTIVRTGDRLDGYRGMYNEARGQLDVDRGLYNPSDKRSTLLHELQHGVQAQEDFARGANESIAMQIKNEADAKIPAINQRLANISKAKQAAEDAGDVSLARNADVEYRKAMREKEELLDAAMEDPFDVYRRVAGEVEARNVQARRDMTPAERRATPPWVTQDILDEEQIVRYLNGRQALYADRQGAASKLAELGLGVGGTAVAGLLATQQSEQQREDEIRQYLGGLL